MTTTDRRLLVEAMIRDQAAQDKILTQAGHYDAEIATYIADLLAVVKRGYEDERHTRQSLLRIHAWLKLWVGALILVAGGPFRLESEAGVWTRTMLGFWALIAGVTLLYGLRRFGGGHRVELVGLVLTGLWDIALSVQIVLIVFTYPGPWRFAWPWQLTEISPDQPRLFAFCIYIAFVFMVWGVHFQAILRERRRGRASA